MRLSKNRGRPRGTPRTRRTILIIVVFRTFRGIRRSGLIRSYGSVLVQMKSLIVLVVRLISLKTLLPIPWRPVRRGGVSSFHQMCRRGKIPPLSVLFMERCRLRKGCVGLLVGKSRMRICWTRRGPFQTVRGSCGLNLLICWGRTKRLEKNGLFLFSVPLFRLTRPRPRPWVILYGRSTRCRTFHGRSVSLRRRRPIRRTNI